MLQLNPQLKHTDCSVYDLLLDWVEPYNSVAHSSGVLGLRCADVAAHDLGKGWNMAIVAIIPGALLASVCRLRFHGRDPWVTWVCL